MAKQDHSRQPVLSHRVQAGNGRTALVQNLQPLIDARAMVGRIVTADIPEETKRKVLGLNAAKLLGLDV